MCKCEDRPCCGCGDDTSDIAQREAADAHNEAMELAIERQDDVDKLSDDECDCEDCRYERRFQKD